MAENNTRQFPESIQDETTQSVLMQVVVGTVFAALLCFLLQVAIRLTP